MLLVSQFLLFTWTVIAFISQSLSLSLSLSRTHTHTPTHTQRTDGIWCDRRKNWTGEMVNTFYWGQHFQFCRKQLSQFSQNLITPTNWKRKKLSNCNNRKVYLLKVLFIGHLSLFTFFGNKLTLNFCLNESFSDVKDRHIYLSIYLSILPTDYEAVYVSLFPSLSTLINMYI